jgi:hypothetical protein
MTPRKTDRNTDSIAEGVDEVFERAATHPGCPHGNGKEDPEHNYHAVTSVEPTEDPEEGPLLYIAFHCSCGHEQERYI